MEQQVFIPEDHREIIIIEESKKEQKKTKKEQLKEDLSTGPYLYRKTRPQDKVSKRSLLPFAIGLISFCFIFSIYMMLYLPFNMIAFTILPFSVMFILLVYTYYKAVYTCPGYVTNYNPNCSEQEKEEAKQRAIYGKQKGFKVIDVGYPARYCCQCNEFKMPRSYHCKVCKHCVMNRDHHCVWINNCVGKYNLKYFILLLMYLPINIMNGAFYCIYGLVMTLLHYSNTALIVFHLIGSLFCDILMIGLGFAILSLLVHHLGLVLANITSMEELEKLRFNCLSHHKKEPFPSYDKGVINNIKEVMGRNPLIWLLPVQDEEDTHIEEELIAIDVNN